MKIAVIGAGLTGLTAAKLLSDYVNVKVFEAQDLGGLLSSYQRGYYIEKFYHHCFRFDKDLLHTLKELNLSSKLVWKTVKVGFAVGKKIYSLSTPFEILRYPHLSFAEKVKLALFTIRSRKKNYEKYDDIGVIEGIKSELGESLFKKFFLPLLKSKFGKNYEKISYAWLLARVAIRSNRKISGEEIGYLRGGFHQLIERLCEGLEIAKKRAKIKKRKRWEVCGEEFDAVIFTAPLPELGDLKERFHLPDIKYQSSICVLIGSKEGLTDDIYWTNIYDDLPFGAIIEHTNFMPFEDYGEHVIYLASYSTPEGELYKMNDEEIIRLFLKGLSKYGFREDRIKWIKVFRAKYSGPIYEKGYLRKVTPYKIADGFYLAGMTSKPNYPERSMNGSIKAGIEVAETIKKDLL